MLKNGCSYRVISSAFQNLSLNRRKFLCHNKLTSLSNFKRGKRDDTSISSLFIPVPIKATPDDINVGAELTGSLNKADLLKVLNKFYQEKQIKMLLTENGLDSEYKVCLYFFLENTIF